MNLSYLKESDANIKHYSLVKFMHNNLMKRMKLLYVAESGIQFEHLL